MYEFLEEKSIKRTRENECWTYLLEDEDKFSKSGYKSAQLQLKDCMLKCAVIRFDGQLKFIYFPGECKSLVEILSTMQPNRVWYVFGKVLESIIKVKNYGYLDCENIDIAPQNIYIDPKTFAAHLIYVPLVAEKNHTNYMNFEASLKRSFVVALRESNNAIITERENKLLEVLNCSGQSLEDMLNVMMQQSGGRYQIESKSNGLRLVCADKRIAIDYEMKKDKISIGRKKDNDIVIDFSNHVSRIHCSIHYKNGKYYVIDEKSTYGTYVNKTPCTPGRPIELHSEDLLRLPGIQFLVKL